MDFVQRNLINERNDLQIELAKANILIAQLNELSNKTLGSYIKKAAGVNTEPGFVDWRKRNDVMTLAHDAEGITDAGGDASEFRNKLKNRQKGIGRAVDRIIKPMSEEAEYISDLENVIMSIAEQLEVDPNDLLNEVRAVTNAEIAANPVKNARNINRIQAVVDRIHNRTQMPGMHSPIGARKDAYDSERAKHMLGALGVKAAVRTGGIGVKVASDRRPNEAGEALTKDTNVQMGSNDGLRANDALKSNIMTANKAARPAGPVADTRQRQPKGMSTFLPRSL